MKNALSPHTGRRSFAWSSCSTDQLSLDKHKGALLKRGMQRTHEKTNEQPLNFNNNHSQRQSCSLGTKSLMGIGSPWFCRRMTGINYRHPSPVCAGGGKS